MHNRSISIKAMITPPPAWGQPSQVGRPRQDHRYTPTHVGRTHPRDCEQTGPTVHPHSRGENALNLSQAWRISGTPPLAWGERRIRNRDQPAHRYTPTRVGRTSDGRPSGARHRYTPTRVGRTAIARAFASASAGTPPLAWGEQGQPVREVDIERYTPTRVGRTVFCELAV